MKTAWMIIAGVLTLGVAASLYVGYSTFAYSGDRAFSRLTPEEQPYLMKYNQLHSGMTYDQVLAILGEPSRDGLGIRPTWCVNNSGFNQIAVYFQDGRLRKVRWMHIGRFVLEK